MKHLSLTQKLCMAGWLVAAALLIAVNAVPFVSLEEAALDQEPAQLRALRTHLGLLENLATAHQRPLSDLDQIGRAHV
jgi:hypothetical protein